MHRSDYQESEFSRFCGYAFIGGWLLILAGLLIPQLAFIGAWVVILSFLCGIGALLYDKGRARGRQDNN